MRGRATGTGRRTWILIAGVSLVVAGVVAAAVAMTPKDADPPPADQTAVPERLALTIVAAAASCPELTPPRLAAQIMAESAFSSQATTPRGGRGIAGLTDDAWATWAPWPDAQRTDDQANIVALAHLMCDLTEKLMASDVMGDPWRLALAAYDTTLEDVLGMGAVPSAAQPYVDRVVAYAEAYSRLAMFQFAGVDPSPSAAAPSNSPSVTVTPTVAMTNATPTPTRPPDPVESTNPALVPLPALAPTPVAGEVETTLRAWQSVLCLTAGAGTDVFPALCDGSPEQQWTLRVNGELTFVRNVKTGRCLDGNDTGATYTSGCWWNDEGQRWQLTRFGANGVTAFRVVHSLFGRCLDARQSPDTTPCRADVWPQLWYVDALT